MPTVLIIDDHLSNRNALSSLIRTIEDHLNVECFRQASEALGWLQWHQADLVLVDYRLPELDGIAFIREARHMPLVKDVPVLLVGDQADRDCLQEGLDAGASDFLWRPWDDVECFARCRNLLTQQWQQKIIRDRARWLEKQVAEAITEVRIREHETLLRLAKAGEYRDEETGNHVIRMAKYSRLIAEAMGRPLEECDNIELAAPMHDIGKIGIPDQILRKPARLTAEEYMIMQSHTEIGYEILKDSPSQYLQLGAVIALNHHEHFDGTGYPNGLRGNEIPLPARIVAVADAYDALTSIRPYKPAWNAEQAMTFLNDSRGSHFDPDCIDAFSSQMQRVLKIQHLLADPPEHHQIAK